MKWISGVFLGGLVACASAYDLSEQGVRYRASLAEAVALSTVKQSAFGSAEQQGVCSAHTNEQFEQAESVSLDGSTLVFTSYYSTIGGSSVTGNTAAGTWQVHVSRVRHKGTFKIDLRQLHKIRVLRDIEGYGCLASPRRPPGAYIVMIDNPGMGDVSAERPNGVMINVSEQNLDRFVAALSLLSPQARTIQGTGF
jgi:hypothetical protein